MLNIKGTNTVFFKRFLISYTFVLVVPLVLASFTSRTSTRVIEENAIQTRLSILNQAKDIIDKHFMELDEMMIQIALHPKLNLILSLPEPGDGDPRIYHIWDYGQDLRFRTVTTSVFKSTFYVFCNNSEFIFSHDNIYFGYERFYRDVISYPAMDYSRWKELFFEKRHFRTSLPALDVLLDEGRKRYITYINSIPLMYNIEPQGVIVFLIAEEDLTRLFADLSVPDEGWITVKAGEETILSTNSEPDAIEWPSGQEYRHIMYNGKETVVVRAFSSYHGWSYYAGFPYRAVTEKVRIIGRTATVVAGTSLTVGLLISFFLAFWNTKPFRELTYSLREFFGSEGNADYEFLTGSINRLINDTRSMRSELAHQSETMKQVFLDRLLKGEFENRIRMITLMNHVGFKIEGDQFLVLVLRINRAGTVINTEILNELEATRVLIENTIKRSFRRECLPHVLDENRMAVVLSYSGKDPNRFKNAAGSLISTIGAEFSDRYGIDPTIGIGGIYPDLYEVHHSFREALQAIDYSSKKTEGTNGPGIWHDEITGTARSIFYPLDLEVKIINLTKIGNREELENILKRIHHENCEVRLIPPDLENILLANMNATLVKLNDEFGGEIGGIEVPNLQESLADSGAGRFEKMQAIFLSACDTAARREQSQNRRTIKRILDYIENHYTDWDLSVASIASEFRLSESYFSHFFKIQIGENFSAYVEALRIGTAKQLLSEAGKNVDESAALVGYRNTSSFRRAFKRVTGTSPSSFK